MGHASALTVALDATPLLGRPTGVGVFCSGLLEGLAARDDVAPCAFAVSWRRRKGVLERLPAGVRWRQRPMPARPLQRAWRTLELPPIEWFVGRVDVVHGTNFVVPPTRRAARVVTVHDLTPVRFPQLCHPATLAFADLVRRAIRRGAWVHTHSCFVAEEVIEVFGADPGKVRPVPPGVPAVSGAASSFDRVRHLLPPSTGRYLLAIGTAEPRKDFPGLVAAFDAIAGDRPELTLVLAGPEGWGSTELAHAIARSPNVERIVQTGWLEPVELDALLRSAAALVFPSLYEGFGIPPLQAMAAGVPVVATRAGAVPEVVGDAAELVAPRDPSALAGALAHVLDSEERRAELLAAGARRVAGFSWDRCAAGLSAIYRDAAGER